MANIQGIGKSGKKIIKRKFVERLKNERKKKWGKNISKPLI